MDYSGNIVINNNMRKSQSQKLFASESSKNISDDDYKKRTMHRDIERQRRQEIATLHASLRDLLPLEYIKGKRAISDHIDGALNYFKDSQQRIKETSAKRDELKKLSNLSVVGTETSSNNSDPSFTVSVNPCSSGGIEVLISTGRTGFEVQALPLSRVLEVILEQGLSVICCVSTRVNERLIQTIQVEVTDLTCFDISGFRQKLIEEITLLTGRVKFSSNNRFTI